MSTSEKAVAVSKVLYQIGLLEGAEQIDIQHLGWDEINELAEIVYDQWSRGDSVASESERQMIELYANRVLRERFPLVVEVYH